MPSILFLTAYPDEDASCRYRVHQFIPYLEAEGFRCTVEPFATPELFRSLRSRGKSISKVTQTAYCALRRAAVLRQISRYDLIMIHREAFPLFAPLVEGYVLRRHQRVVFSFDDAIHVGHGDLSNLSHPVLYRIKHGGGYDEVIRRSSHVIAGNSILAEHARKLNNQVTVVPTVIDVNRFWANPCCGQTGQAITIGWVGGPSTAPYLSMVESALQEVARDYDQVRFRFFGCPSYRPPLPRAESLPFNLITEADDVRSLDIGLMPMPDTSWTRGKCGFKAIQYMSCGVAAVASPVGMTTELIQDGVNGILAESKAEWYAAMERLILDVEWRRVLTARARNTIIEKYSIQVWGPRLAELFHEILGPRTTAIPSAIAA